MYTKFLIKTAKNTYEFSVTQNDTDLIHFLYGMNDELEYISKPACNTIVHKHVHS